MARSRRNEDRGGERRWTFDGVEYPTRKPVCAARREEGVRLPDEEGMNFTQAAHAVGVSKRAGKVWRNGRTRATGGGRKGKHGLVSFRHGRPKRIHARHLNQEERIPVYFVKLRWTCSALNLNAVGFQVEHRRRLVPCFVVCLVYFMRECLFR